MQMVFINLPVTDIARSRAFYESVGWAPAQAGEGVVFYQMHGAVLALFGRADLAADQGRPGAVLGTGAITLAQNFPTEAAVDAAWQAAVATALSHSFDAPA